MALNIPTKIDNNLDNYSLDANQVKGGFGVVAKFSDLATLPTATIVKGSLYYVTEDDKFYQYDSSTWTQKVYTKGQADTLLDAKMPRVTTAAEDSVAKFDANGNVTGSSIPASRLILGDESTPVPEVVTVDADTLQGHNGSYYKVDANPTLTGGEATLNSIKIEGTSYKVETSSPGTTDFEQLSNRPKYNNSTMNKDTNIPEVKTNAWDAKLDDAPSDNKKYVRKDGTWVEFVDEDTKDFDLLTNRPKYNGTTMDHDTNIPEIKTTAWDAKSVVSVSSTGTATDEINYITIDGVEKKIAGGGGGSLPTGTAPGQGLVYNGSTWSVQDGYAYYQPGDTQILQWNGDTTGKEMTHLEQMNFAKMIDTSIPHDNINEANCSLMYQGYEEELQLVLLQQVGDNFRVYGFGGLPLVVCADQETTWLGGTFTVGTWFLGMNSGESDDSNETYDTYTYKLNYGTIEKTIQFDQKYVFPKMDYGDYAVLKYKAAKVLAHTGKEWTAVEGNGFALPHDQGDFEYTWDGDPTGKEHIYLEEWWNFYKISNNIPNTPLYFAGGTLTYRKREDTESEYVTESVEVEPDCITSFAGSGKIFTISRWENNYDVLIVLEDTEFMSQNFTKGVWFNKQENEYPTLLKNYDANWIYVQASSRILPLANKYHTEQIGGIITYAEYESMMPVVIRGSVNFNYEEIFVPNITLEDMTAFYGWEDNTSRKTIRLVLQDSWEESSTYRRRYECQLLTVDYESNNYTITKFTFIAFECDESGYRARFKATLDSSGWHYTSLIS